MFDKSEQIIELHLQPVSPPWRLWGGADNHGSNHALVFLVSSYLGTSSHESSQYHKRYSYYSGDSMGFRSSVPGTRDKNKTPSFFLKDVITSCYAHLSISFSQIVWKLQKLTILKLGNEHNPILKILNHI